MGSARSRDRLGPLWLRVLGLVAACVVLTVLLQSAGVTPAVRTG